MFLSALCTAKALDPHRAISQFLHRQWTIDDGFPVGPVSALAQTPDGNLWIGGERGLCRFDGLNFEMIRPSPAGVHISYVLGLTTDQQGALWVWMQGANVLRYQSGSFATIKTGSASPDANVTSLSRGPEGNIILSTLEQQIYQYENGRQVSIHKIDPPHALILTNAKTTNGRIWLGTRDLGLLSLENGRVHSVSGSIALKKINCLLPSTQNDLWMGTDDGLFFSNGSQFSRLPLPASFRHLPILTIKQDRDQNLWIGTTSALFRVATPGDLSKSIVTEHRTRGSVNALFEDREGNLWIGTSRGLESWRDPAFQAYAKSSGLPPGGSGSVHVDSVGTVWCGPAQGGLYTLHAGRAHLFKEAHLQADVVYSISGYKNDVWIGRKKGGLTHFFRRGDQLASETFTKANGLAENSVYAVHESPNGTVWAGTLNAGLSRLKDGHWRTYTATQGLGSNTIVAIEDGPGADLWVGTSNGLNALQANRWHTYRQKDGLPSDEVTSLLYGAGASSNAVLWVGTAEGLAFLVHGKFHNFKSDSEVLSEPIWGLAKDLHGFLWISTPNHILRVSQRRLLEGGVTSADVREYTRADGLGGSEGLRRTRSMTSDGAGNIWISTATGLAVTEPTYMRHKAAASIVQIQELLADSRPIDLSKRKIPASSRRIEVDYSGLSLSAPNRVRYRFRLDGFDRNWTEPVSSRRAVYTHLDPGHYRFRVVASNSDGIWNSSETSLPFLIEPAIWQTWWFRSCCLLATALLTWCAYLVRVRQIAKHHDMLFEERLGERMRIAQELHDTLLQSLHALVLRFQAVSNLLPSQPERAKESLDVGIERAASAITESRDAVQELRTSRMNGSDLVLALSRLGQETGADQSDAALESVSTTFRVLVEGKPRPVDSSVSDDLYRIAREAVSNSLRHAHASQIELDLLYDERKLRLRVRDDGIGIAGDLLAKDGRPGHWGLPGMRERARRMGGQLEIWSEYQKGTEIELIIPGFVAYGKFGARRRSKSNPLNG